MGGFYEGAQLSLKVETDAESRPSGSPWCEIYLTRDTRPYFTIYFRSDVMVG